MEKWKKNLIALFILISINLVMLIVVYIIVPFILPEYPFNIGFLLFGVVALVFGSVDIAYILTFRKKNRGKYFIRFGWWRLNEKKIKKYVDIDLWEGAGTQDSPYRVADWNKLPNNLMIDIAKSSSYITIQNGNPLRRIILKDCQNISINNCELSYLKLSMCINSIITNNIIHSLSVFSSFNNKINNNRLSKKGLEILKKKSIIQRNEIDNNSLYIKKKK
ncbi:MAG: hypothetical protein ACFE8L_11285 [Candidatus Hodarchaeota archaeon]